MIPPPTSSPNGDRVSPTRKLRRPLLYTSVVMLSAVAVVASIFLCRDTLIPRSRHSRDDAAAAEITWLRGSDRYQDALNLGRVHQRELQNDCKAAPWQKADAARLVATLEHITSLPDSSREALAEADRNDAIIARTLIDAEYRHGVVLAQKQIATRRRLLGEDHPDVAVSLTALGELARFQGDWRGALDLHTRALELRRKVLGEKHPDFARSLEMVGKAEQVLNHPEEARAHYQQSLILRQELFGKSHPAVTSSLNSLADLSRRRQRYDEAIPLFQEALCMRRRTLGSKHPDVAEILCNLGLTYTVQGNWKKAAPYLHQAVKLSREVPGVSKEVFALSLRLESTVLCRQGKYQEAERDLREDTGLYEAIYGQGKPGIQPSHDHEVYTKLAATELMLGNGEEAWASLERGLSRTLLDESVPPDRNGRSTKSDPERAPGNPRIYSLETVRSALSDHAALIGWLDDLHDHYGNVEYPIWGYVIRHTGPIQWVRIGSPPGAYKEATSRRVIDFSFALRDEASWPFRKPVSSQLVQDAKSVYEERLAPLEKCLGGIDHLIVVQALTMSSVPIEALIDSSGAWVGDRYAVSYTPSGTLYAWMRERRGPVKDPSTWRVLAVGDPDFGSGTKTSQAPPELAARETGDPLGSASPAQIDPGLQTRVLTRQPGAMDSVSRLPGTREEVRRIAGVFPSATLLLGRDASEREITRLATSRQLEEYDLIHFATHTLIDPILSTRSAILLARTVPAVAREDVADSSQDDGLLTPPEIRSTWSLKADLVTLSACQTGRPWGGQEPSIGLAGELIHAGANSLLESLWDVDDRATSLLMGRFYENLAGAYRDSRLGFIGRPMPKAVALQEAKRWLREYRDAQGGQPFSNPVFWAAFILLGDSEDS